MKQGSNILAKLALLWKYYLSDPARTIAVNELLQPPLKGTSLLPLCYRQ